jgi:hypothetical protein
MPFGLIGSSGPSAADYTAARAALIDRLALLAAGGAGELTSARAANLTNLDALITTRLGAINNIQQIYPVIGAGVGTVNTAITAVVMAKTILIDLGAWVTGSLFIDCVARHDLTTTTNVRSVRAGNTLAMNCHVLVVEFT